MRSEVLIIGAGVIGLSIARELIKNGVRDIAIVERGEVGLEASWAAAGMLAPNIEADSDATFHRFGTESLEMYPDFAESLKADTGVDIELDRAGTFCVAFDEEEAAELSEIYGRQRSRGVPVELVDGDDVRSREPQIASSVASALFYPNDWQVENRKLLHALHVLARSNGVKLIEQTEVTDLTTDGCSVSGAVTTAGAFHAQTTILATGAWTSLIKMAGARMSFNVKPVRGQMISFRPGRPLLRHVVYSHRGYLVPRADGRLLVGATVEDVGYRKATTAEAIAGLAAATAEIIPAAALLPVADSWSGLRPFAADGLPLIGNLPGYENAFVATAHYRNGILLAPLTAKIIVDKILHGRESDYFRKFAVERLALTAINAIAR